MADLVQELTGESFGAIARLRELERGYRLAFR